MSKRYYDLAKKNYPTYWNRAMIDNLHDLGRLTDDEYEDIISSDENEQEGV